jgi:hypothetical protein
MSHAASSAVWLHSRSKGSARLVLLAMADEANDQGLLTAYRRSQSWLGRKANVDGGTVRRAITQLAEMGELHVLQRGDGRESSDYVLLLPGMRPLPDELAHLRPAEGVQDAPPAPAGSPPRAREVPPQGAQDAPPIIPLDPVPPAGTPTPRALPGLSAEDAFDRFWEVYPRKAGKGQARKAWAKALAAAGGPEVVIAGAERYRDDPNRVIEFTAHASTWLNGERWADDPLPPRGQQRGHQRPQPKLDTDRDAEAGRLYL